MQLKTSTLILKFAGRLLVTFFFCVTTVRVEAQHKWSLGIGPNTLFTLNQIPDIGPLCVGGQVLGEYKRMGAYSWLIDISYTELFSSLKDYPVDNWRFFTVMGGFRYYPVHNLFAGLKLGYGDLRGRWTGYSGLDCEPHVGYNSRHMQVAIGYNVLKTPDLSARLMRLSFLYKLVRL